MCQNLKSARALAKRLRNSILHVKLKFSTHRQYSHCDQAYHKNLIFKNSIKLHRSMSVLDMLVASMCTSRVALQITNIYKASINVCYSRSTYTVRLAIGKGGAFWEDRKVTTLPTRQGIQVTCQTIERIENDKRRTVSTSKMRNAK